MSPGKGWREVEAEIDVTQLIGRTVELSRSGRTMTGLCPFHEDQKPSLVVFPQTNSFHCFGAGCGAGGGPIQWVKLRDGVGFKEALERLHGWDGPPPALRKVWRPTRRTAERFIPNTLILFWHHQFQDRSYLHDRGFTDETINRELWGWSPDGRVVITVWDDLHENVPQVLRRSADPEVAPRYLGLTGFNQPHLYNSHRAKEAENVIIFFGTLDAALFQQDMDELGLPWVGASPTGGAGVWHTDWNRFLRKCPQPLILPDTQPEEEWKEGHAVRAKIGHHARVIRAPFAQKDYSDFRLAGGSAINFIERVR